jgi:hypothetical protein
MTNFNLERFKTTRSAKTRIGANARFICETNNKLFVEITPLTGTPFTAKYNVDGSRYNGVEHFEDLVN